jgi:hypothetical protein
MTKCGSCGQEILPISPVGLWQVIRRISMDADKSIDFLKDLTLFLLAFFALLHFTT